MRFSGLIRVGILAALMATFVSGLVAYYAPEAKGEISVGGRTAPAWLFWTGAFSIGGVAYFSAVFWLLLRWKRSEDGSPLDFSDGVRALFIAPFVVVFFPFILLGGLVAGAANHSGDIRERMRAIYTRYGRSRRVIEREESSFGKTTCPECGGEACNLPTAGAINCKACGLVST